jgi:hypothetical protein
MPHRELKQALPGSFVRKGAELDVIEAIKARKSIRGYKPDPVPREVLAEILQIVGLSRDPCR